MKCRLSAVFYSLTHLWHTFIAQNCGAVVELAAFDQGVDRGGRRARREHKSIAVAGGRSHEHIATTRAEPKVCRLSAGGDSLERTRLWSRLISTPADPGAPRV